MPFATGSPSSFTPPWEIARRASKEIPEHGSDQVNLKRILARRSEQAQLYFNQIAGRFDRSYGPGRSWQAFGQMLLRVIPPVVVADLGAGEGLLSELLARRAKKVIAVDNSPAMLKAAQKRLEGLDNVELRRGDLEALPIEDESCDAAMMVLVLTYLAEPLAALRAALRA